MSQSSGFWDTGTTTQGPQRTDKYPRTSFFRWQRTEFATVKFWYPHFDWEDIENRRATCVCAGISVGFTPLGVATVLNRRTLITSANYLDHQMDKQRLVRIWLLGRAGKHDSPYRYRVWRIHRLFPKSLNPEHRHGVRGYHSPRHDISIIISFDQMYLYNKFPHRYQYAYRAWLTGDRDRLDEHFIMAGSGYEYLQHIYENYKIFYTKLYKKDVVDCSMYIPKWWGKFICVKNLKFLPGVANGGPMLQRNNIVAIGCFEIRYNEDRIFVFTDLRYYVRWIYKYARITGGDYYEYAYPEWGLPVKLTGAYDGRNNDPKIPTNQIQYDLFPLG